MSTTASVESERATGLAAFDLGIRVYGIAALALGLIAFVWDDFASVWQDVPAGFPDRAALAYAMGAAEVIAGAAMLVPRTARWGAALFAILNAIILVSLQIPRAAAHPLAIGGYGGVAETGAAMLGGVIAFAVLSPRVRVLLLRICWLGYGLCCVVFGAEHFRYLEATAQMVPAYLPPGQIFWARATGAGHIAGGLALLSGIRARLAAQLLTAMFFVFQLLVHLPVLLKDPTTHFNWTINAWNLVLVGSAWIVADSLRGRRVWGKL